eukprot:CAMPEP_0114374788 /NCGR_PEP_ID=MMETSP0101-20121206/35870_1 /TAXON_ID=38822 ORGANISM="Pteridomonas danica, Strain PT" /NCGR_SAMPLE_ID=MMETSP0101 /ASSEMBLY_ACC=CAM_ASM_000211 /LENGTH=830 /DNA_ID=CAMNT_0001528687 /DNA_START=1 /DNA_END=2493 /DNA_ORIENTATION=-
MEMVNKNYTVEFTTENGVLASIFVENMTSASTEKYDKESGESIEFYFGLITTKDDSGDLKLARLCAAMNNAGIHHHTYDAKSGADYRMTRMGATKSRLEGFADATNFKLGLNPVKIEEASFREEIDLENRKNTDWYKPYDHLFAPFEIEKKELYNGFTPMSYLILFKRLILQSPRMKDEARGCGFDLNRLESTLKDNKFCLGIFPLHDMEAKEALEEQWMPLDYPWKIPATAIKNYFGEEIGFYFKFLAHLATGLSILAVFAVACQIWGFVGMANGDPIMMGEVVFALIGVCSYSVILDNWHFEQSKVAHLWEVYNCQKHVPPRPGFKGLVLKNPTNGRLEIDFPESKRRPRRLLSLGASATFIVVLLGTVLSIFIYKAILTASGATGGMLLVPALLNSFQMTVFGFLYKSVAERLTEFENHRSLAQHNSELFKKLTFFYFINYYASLFYIAFVKISVEGCLEALSGSDHCGHELAIQVAVVFIGNDFANRISNSIILPFLTRKYKAYTIAQDDSIAGEKMGPVELQFRLLEKYDPTSALVMDYIELFVQWGYLVLFGSSCPMVVALAAFTNFVETRTDGYKLLHDFRRVVPNRVDGIGEPLNVFYYVLYIAIPVNAGLLVYTFDFGRLASEFKVWIFIAVICGQCLLFTLLDIIFPDMPRKTQIQLARSEVVYERVVMGTPDMEAEELDLDIAMIGKTTRDIKKEVEQKELVLNPQKNIKEGDTSEQLIPNREIQTRENESSLDRPIRPMITDQSRNPEEEEDEDKDDVDLEKGEGNDELEPQTEPEVEPEPTPEPEKKPSRPKERPPGRKKSPARRSDKAANEAKFLI